MSYKFDAQARYARSHEWVRVTGDTAIIGVSDYAQHLLSDVVYVELPEVGDSLTQGDSFATVESVKAAEDAFAPVSGEVIEVNADLEASPEWVNSDPYGKAWLVKVRLSDQGELDEAHGPEVIRDLRGRRRGEGRALIAPRRTLSGAEPHALGAVMTYIPHTDADREEMLRTVGIGAVSELFDPVPEKYRFPELALPPALSEMEILGELQALASENDDLQRAACFLGAGAYRHFVPSVVDFVISRSEFYTAYTPYQPEISQGTLQAHFEYQTMITALTGMEAANVSHYDGGTSVAEAVIMALGAGRGKRKRVVLSPTLHPQYREVVHTYVQGMDLTIAGESAPLGDIDALVELCDDATACVVVQNPDFLGNIYAPADLQRLADRVHECGALFVVSADPVSLGLLAPPGSYGADVATGEGQALGNSLSFGGPYLGFFAMRMRDVRRSAGRIVGETSSDDGRARLRADPQHARAAHPSREGIEQHLQQPGAECAGGCRVYGFHGQVRAA